MEREKDREVIREGSARGVGRRRTVVGVVREDRDRKVKDGGVEGGTGDVEAVQAGSDRERTVNIFEDAEKRVLVMKQSSDPKVLSEGGELVDKREKSNRRIGRGRVRRSVDEVAVVICASHQKAPISDWNCFCSFGSTASRRESLAQFSGKFGLEGGARRKKIL